MSFNFATYDSLRYDFVLFQLEIVVVILEYWLVVVFVDKLQIEVDACIRGFVLSLESLDLKSEFGVEFTVQDSFHRHISRFGVDLE